jgi:hypothetical protein
MIVPLTASATGGVWCDAKDANMEFHFKAVSSRDGTGGWFAIEGTLQTFGSKLPANLAKFDIKDENLTERWWDGTDVRLLVQKFNDAPFSRVELSLITKSVDEGLYNGNYELNLTLADGSYVQKSGAVVCDAD